MKKFKLLFSYILIIICLKLYFSMALREKRETYNSKNHFECGISNKINKNISRIVGGQITEPNEFPWMVGLYQFGSFFCGGSLITERHILTAGHCVVNIFHMSKLYAILGMHNNRKKDGKKYLVRKIFNHPTYHHSIVPMNDLSILSLSKVVTFSEKIRTVCLPLLNLESDYAGHNAVVPGWGNLAEHLPGPELLHKVNIVIQNESVCYGYSAGTWKLDEVDFKNLICGFPNGKDSCQGDSGGGLLVEVNNRYRIIGIVSFGMGCGRREHPGVYTKIIPYLKWINSIIRNTRRSFLGKKILN